jgi:hypothetical protein
MAVGEVNRPDGLPDVVVAESGPDGPAALVLEPVGAFRASPEVPLPEPASAPRDRPVRRNDYTHDVAIGAGVHLVLVHGRDRRLGSGVLRRAEVLRAAIDTLLLESPISAGGKPFPR